MDKKKHYIVLNDTFVNSEVKNNKKTLVLCINILKYKQCREDFRELLKLTVIFLGAIPSRGI